MTDEEFDVHLDPDTEELATILIRVGVKEDPQDPEDYILQTNFGVRRHDEGAMNGAYVMAACITALKQGLVTMEEKFTSMYGSTDVIKVDEISRGDLEVKYRKVQ